MSPKNPPTGAKADQSRSSSTRGKAADADAAVDADCTFDQVADLAGVRMDAAAGIKFGDILDVRVRGDAPNKSVVCVTRPGGAAVGAVVGIPGLARLIRCIEAGNAYEAQVLVRERVRCQVRIANAGAPRR
jgi:hypothetical protein